jgi:hypothetical protein
MQSTQQITSITNAIMATPQKRIQVLLRPTYRAAVEKLADYNDLTLSMMCAALIKDALTLPKYQQQLENDDDQEVTLTIKELKTLLDVLIN